MHALAKDAFALDIVTPVASNIEMPSRGEGGNAMRFGTGSVPKRHAVGGAQG